MQQQFRLAGPQGDGCHPYVNETGAFIGRGVPLLDSTPDAIGRARFLPRPVAQLEALLAKGYGAPIDGARLEGHLRAVANALNDGDLVRAAIALLHANLPPLPDETAAERLAKADRELRDRIAKWREVRVAAVDANGLAKYSRDQPRAPKGQPGGGQWTRDGGSDEESASPGRAGHGRDMSGVETAQRNDRQERNEDGESARTRIAESGEIRSDATRAPAPAPTSRALTPGEIELARSLFGDEIGYNQVQIYHEKNNPFQRTEQTVAIRGNIYFPSDNPTYRDDFAQEDVASEEGVASQAHFLHEMTHLAQEQEGIDLMLAYASDHNYYYEIDGNSPRPLHTYGIEQQATIVEDYFRLKHGLGPTQPGQTAYPLSVYERVLAIKDDGTIGAPLHIHGVTPIDR